MDTSYLETIKEFMLFEHFISEGVLNVFYAFCVFLIPVVTWYFLFWLVRRYAVAIKFYKSGRYSLFFSFLLWIIRKIKFFRDKIDQNISWQTFTPAQKIKFVGLFFVAVVLSELFLRLTFEYLIAYMQIHESLKPHHIPQ